MPTYRLTLQAEADLKAIYRYGWRIWGQTQAVRYARQLQQCFRRLAEHPHTGKRQS
jgi:plasmid stabilization system protein ParE